MRLWIICICLIAALATENAGENADKSDLHEAGRQSPLGCGLPQAIGLVALPAARLTEAPGFGAAWSREVRARIQQHDVPRLESARGRELAAVEGFQAFLREEPLGESLQRVYGIDALVQELASSQPNVASLNEAYARLRRPLPGREQTAIEELRRATAAYATQLLLHQDAEVKRAYLAYTDRLGSWMESRPTASDRQSESSLREAYACLARSGMFDDLLKGVQPAFSRPNQTVLIRSAMLTSAVPSEGSQPVRINQVQQGAHIIGQGVAHYHAIPSFRPNPNRGEVAVQVQGTADMSVRAHKQPVTVCAQGRSAFSVWMPFYTDGRTVEAGKPSATAEYRSVMTGLEMDSRRPLLGLLEPVVWRVASRQLAEADQQASSQAKREIESRATAESDTILARINEVIHDAFWQTLEISDIDPQVRVSSTQDALWMTAEYVGPWQLGALIAPPDMQGAEYEATACLHESAVNNVAVLLAGRSIDEPTWQELVFGNLRGDAELARIAPGPRAPAALIFDEREPLQVQFTDGQAVIMLRIRGFEYSGQAYAVPARAVRVVYALEGSGKKVNIQRVGPVDFGSSRAIEDELLRQILEWFFPQRATVEPFARWKLPAHLIQHLAVHNGWLAYGLVDPSKAVGKRNGDEAHESQ